MRIEFKENNKDKISTGFFLKININNKKYYFLLTCHHSITQENIDSKIMITIYYGKFENETQKNIELDNNKRFIKCYEDLDCTLIEILNEDEIDENKYLNPDLNYKNGFNQYEKIQIYTAGYPNVKKYKGEKHLSSGIITKINENEFDHTCETRQGSSGSPLLNDNKYVIGMHYGCDKNEETNYGVFIGSIIDKLNEDIKGYPLKIINKNEEENKDDINIKKEEEKLDNTLEIINKEDEEEKEDNINYKKEEELDNNIEIINEEEEKDDIIIKKEEELDHHSELINKDEEEKEYKREVKKEEESNNHIEIEDKKEEKKKEDINIKKEDELNNHIKVINKNEKEDEKENLLSFKDKNKEDKKDINDSLNNKNKNNKNEGSIQKIIRNNNFQNAVKESTRGYINVVESIIDNPNFGLYINSILSNPQIVNQFNNISSMINKLEEDL